MGKVLCNELTTAGGRIKCLRCTAQSSRTKEQCARPALNSSRTQKCQFHGGRQSGPKTEEGRKRIGLAHTVHGQESKQSRRDRSASSALLNQLEDAMHVLGMTSSTRTRGRKPNGYMPVCTVTDVQQLILDIELHRVRGSFEGQ